MTSTLREVFTAWAMCPRCEAVECHWLRPPREYTPHADIHIRMMQEMLYPTFGGPKRLRLHEEQRFEVIRACIHCTHEWGQH